MRRRRVAIIYTTPLFAGGIECLLRADARLETVCLDAGLQGVAEELARLQPEVIVAEHDGNGTHLGGMSYDRLGGKETPLVIMVGLKDAGMELLYSRRVVTATPGILLEAVLGNRSRKRRAPAQ